MNLSGAVFRKSSHSGPNGCVEIAFVDGHVAMRDSKHKDGPVLVFAAGEFRAFLDEIDQFPPPVPTPLD